MPPAAQLWTADELAAWLLAAQPGEAVCYHVGNVARERAHNRDVRHVAELAWRTYLDGRVDLVQRRIDKDAFAYIAQRRLRCIPCVDYHVAMLHRTEAQLEYKRRWYKAKREAKAGADG